MACEERLHLGGIGLARCEVGVRRQHLLVKSLGSPHREHREVDHRGSPILAARQGKLKPQPANNIRSVGNIGLSTPQRETAYHREAPGPKYDRFGETDAVAVALEEPI